MAEKSSDGYLLKYGDNVLCTVKSSGVIKLKKGQRSLYYLKEQDTTCLSVIGQANTTIKTIIEIVEGENND